MRTNLSVEEALEAVLEAEGPYASGRLTYPAGGDLRVGKPQRLRLNSDSNAI